MVVEATGARGWRRVTTTRDRTDRINLHESQTVEDVEENIFWKMYRIHGQAQVDLPAR